MKKQIIINTAKVAIPLTLVVITGVIVGKTVKEYKRQLAAAEEDHKFELEQKEKELAETKDSLKSAVFDDVDPELGIVENPEFAEMRERYKNPTNSPTVLDVNPVSSKDIWNEREMKQELEQEKVEAHNAFAENPVFDATDEDIPHEKVVEKEKEIKANLDKVKLPKQIKAEDKVIEMPKPSTPAIHKKHTESDGEEAMRYQPDSQEAYDAYVNMCLSDVDTDKIFANDTVEEYRLPYGISNPDGIMNIVANLFNFRINFSNEYDANLMETFLDKRFQYFGADSIYSNSASFGELVLWYAEKLSEDVGMSNLAWIQQIISNLDLYNPNHDMATVAYTVEQVMMHEFVNPTTETFGMFGLTPSDAAFSTRGESARFLAQYNSYISRVLADEEEGEPSWV